MAHITDTFIKEQLARHNRHHQEKFSGILSEMAFEKLRPAAVVLPLLRHRGVWHLLLTHRSESLAEHRGQVAFPGGAKEPGDPDLQWTALREMREEIGVEPQDVTIFGHLGDMPIVTGYLIRPYVGEIPWPYDLTISEDEVESVFVVPLKWLTDPDHRTIQYRSFVGREFPVIFFDHYEGHQLWGASAEMTCELLRALELVG
jgi:8-oxo-dGTP pyrophosphatase MutT (NUDIX family)